MAKVVGTVTCTNCGKEHDATVDLDNLPKISNAKLIEEAHNDSISKQVTELSETVKKLSEKPAVQEPPKKATISAPPFVKKAKCKNCDKLHDNPNNDGRAKGQ